MSNVANSTDSTPTFSERSHRTSDGTDLHVYEWTSHAAEQGEKPVIVLLHGYAEHCGRYREFAEYLVAAGHPVLGYDARGHGRSPCQRGHIERYDQYVEDLHGFATEVRRSHPTRGLIVLGHSHGGLTALRMVQTRPPLADALVLTCPLVELQVSQKPLPFLLARVLSRLFGAVSVPSGLNSADLTHDSVLVERHRHDALIHSRSSPRWYVTATRAMEQAMLALNAVRLPVLVLVADNDRIVRPEGVKRMYAGLASSDKELVVCNNSFHEVLNEVDRQQTYAKIGAWLAAHSQLRTVNG